MTPTALSPVLAAFGLGIGLASAPGPVQAVLLAESVRDGMAQGVRALAGAHLTFVVLLVGLALGLWAAAPRGLPLRILEVAGGVFLVGLAIDGLRSGHRPRVLSNSRPKLTAAVRGSLAILLNPGGWIFLAAVASPLLAAAAQLGGSAGSLAAALALSAGAATGDAGLVVLGGAGLRRSDERLRRWILRVLAALLAGLGAALMVHGLTG